jgi:hypothetical protein
VRATMRDVTIQILALEDVFIRNEREQEKREVIEREERMRKMMHDQMQEKAEAAAKQQAEVAAAVAAKQAEAVALSPRGAPQSSSTLHLLNPSYNKF